MKMSLRAGAAPLLGLLLAVSGMLACARTDDEGAWRLRAFDEEQGIEVYLRERHDGLPQFLAVTRVQARLATLVSVLQDRDAMPDWVYRTREVQLLEQTGPTRGLVRVITDMPWPLSDRESIVAWTLEQDPRTLEVVYRGRDANDRAAPWPDVVRMPFLVSGWSFRPLGGGAVEVRFTGRAHLGGNIGSGVLAAFIANTSWLAPLETVRGLRAQIALPRHRDAAVPFVRELP